MSDLEQLLQKVSVPIGGRIKINPRFRRLLIYAGIFTILFIVYAIGSMNKEGRVLRFKQIINAQAK